MVRVQVMEVMAGAVEEGADQFVRTGVSYATSIGWAASGVLEAAIAASIGWGCILHRSMEQWVTEPSNVSRYLRSHR